MNSVAVSLLVGLTLILALGCGAGVDAVHAGIAQGALEAQVAFEPVIRGARRDAMTGAVDRVHTAGGTREQAEAAVGVVRQHWQCAVDGHRLFGTAVGTYVDALWLEQVGGGGFDFATLGPFVRRILDAYRATASCVSGLGLELPVPDFLDLLPPTWALGGDDDG